MRPVIAVAGAMLLSGMVAAQEVPSTGAAKSDPRAPDAVRCQRQTVTGSLAKVRRVCKTNEEWSRDADQTRRDSEDFMDRMQTTPVVAPD
jgi:hypothetical protein